MTHKKPSFLWIIIFGFFTVSCMQMPQQGNDPFANMSDEEFAQMLNFIDTMSKEFEKEYNKLTPEQQAQVDRELREELIKNGIDPDTLQPLTQPAPELPAPTTLPEQPRPTQPAPVDRPITPPAPGKYTAQQAAQLVQKLLSLIESCRYKISLGQSDSALLRHWLSMLAYYVKIIQTPEHLQRLTQSSYERLFQLLTKLETILSTYEPQIIILKTEAEHDTSLDPYRILGLSPRATADDIHNNYQALQSAYDLSKIEADLAAQKMSPQRITRHLDVIKLQLRNIEDAYQQLKDPKLRAQIDRNLVLMHRQEAALKEEAQQIITEFQHALHQVILNGLFEVFDQFFAQFEPIAVARRKEMELAENNRRNEQEARHRLTATPSTNHAQESFGDYYDRYYHTPEPTPYAQPYQPSAPSPEQRSGTAGSIPQGDHKDGAGTQKPSGGKAAAPLATKEKQTPEGPKKEADQKKKQGGKDGKQKTPQQLATEFRKELSELDKLVQHAGEVFSQEKNKNLLATLKSSELTDDNKKAFAALISEACGKDAKLAESVKKVRTLADELVKLEPQAQQVIINDWSRHKSLYKNTYQQFTLLAKSIKKFSDNNQDVALPEIFKILLATIKDIAQLDKLARIEARPTEEAEKKRKKSVQLPIKPNEQSEKYENERIDREQEEDDLYLEKVAESLL